MRLLSVRCSHLLVSEEGSLEYLAFFFVIFHAWEGACSLHAENFAKGFVAKKAEKLQISTEIKESHSSSSRNESSEPSSSLASTKLSSDSSMRSGAETLGARLDLTALGDRLIDIGSSLSE